MEVVYVVNVKMDIIWQPIINNVKNLIRFNIVFMDMKIIVKYKILIKDKLY